MRRPGSSRVPRPFSPPGLGWSPSRNGPARWCLSEHRRQRWIKVFNPSSWFPDCTHDTNRGLVNLSTAFTLGVKWFETPTASRHLLTAVGRSHGPRDYVPHLSRKSPISVRPRGTRPAPPVEFVDRELDPGPARRRFYGRTWFRFRADEGSTDGEIKVLGNLPRLRKVELAEGGPAFEQEAIAEVGRVTSSAP